MANVHPRRVFCVITWHHNRHGTVLCIFHTERREEDGRRPLSLDLRLSDESEYARAALSKTSETRRYVAYSDK